MPIADLVFSCMNASVVNFVTIWCHMVTEKVAGYLVEVFGSLNRPFS